MDMTNTTPRQDRRSVAEQAADWVVELTEAGAEERAAFTAWLTESPRHVEEYLFAANLYKELDGVDSKRQIDVRTVLADARTNIVSLQDEPHLTPALSPPSGRRGSGTMRRCRGFTLKLTGVR